MLVLLGIIFFPRADLPVTVLEDICIRYNIRFDTTSLERIYHDPESILVDPEKFIKEGPAYVLLSKHRARMFDPFPFEAWVKDIEKLASQPEARRVQQVPFRLYELIIAHQQSFCQ